MAVLLYTWSRGLGSSFIETIPLLGFQLSEFEFSLLVEMIP